MGNPLNSIVDLYTDAVEKADSIGLSEVYKQATGMAIAALNKECSFGVTVEDIEYLDGYFIFGKGTNSVVHFHVKETPGWKYGIWWEPVRKSECENDEAYNEYHVDCLRCKIFTQYEDEIDKFKPSASMVSDEFIMSLSGFNESYFWSFAQDIEFIHKEPYLAFYREMYYTDFNREYVSRREAKKYFKKHAKEKAKCNKLTEKNNVDVLRSVYKILKEDIDAGACFVWDRGDTWSPRYTIIGRADEASDAGYYDLFSIFEEPYATKFKKIWDKTFARCRRRLSGWYDHSCFHNSIHLLAREEYEHIFANSKQVDFTKLREM